jgi:hypothetical protein
LDIRHSLPRGPLDSVMLLFGRTPFRCRCCERRFYSARDRTAHQGTAADAQIDQHAG